MGPTTCSDWFPVPFLAEALGPVQGREGWPHAAEPGPAGEQRDRTGRRLAAWRGWGHGAMGRDGYGSE